MHQISHFNTVWKQATELMF